MIQHVDDLYQGQTLYSTYSMGSDKRPHRIKIISMRYNKELRQIVIIAKHGLWSWLRISESELHYWETDEQIAIKRMNHEFVS